MKNFVTLFVLLFAFATANAQCPCCNPAAGASIFSQTQPCPAGQTGAITLLWLCNYGGAAPTTFCSGGQTDCTPNFGLNGFQFLSTSTSCFLPIELSSFNGKIENEIINLDWTTLTESNSNYFVVERSFNGIDFRAVSDEISAAGESDQEQKYTFSDESVRESASSNAVYYRLKQVDYSDEFEYSPVIGFSIEELFTDFEILKVNATPQAMTINFFVGNEVSVNAVVVDMQGKVVFQSEVASVLGANEANLEMDEILPAGIYVISLVNGENVQTEKVFIR